jgi:hypothetical protein
VWVIVWICVLELMLIENGESDLWGLTEWWICGVDVVILGALLDGKFMEFMLMGSSFWVDFSGFCLR